MSEEEILQLSEEDIKFQFITPAITEQAGWLRSNIRMEYSFTDGRILFVGKLHHKKQPKRADYLLFDGDINSPLAVVEAKAAESDLTKGIQQAIEYAAMLDVPFAYSSNGLGFREHDMITGAEREFTMAEFPTMQELKDRIVSEKMLTEEQQQAISTPYFIDQYSHEPRYYQRIAINRTIEAIAKGQQRILLVMATGTGKTFTAFQIIWRLHKSGIKKRILYLADRNVLIDQTMQQDFKPFQKIMTKVKDKQLDSAYEIHMALYQQLVSTDPEKPDPFTQFNPDFFDLVIIDECHRGSAKENSTWRKVLNYFSSATQIGLTATPKYAEGANNIDYFGDPVYTYSLKQGIDDGFLAPYRVTKSFIDVDLDGFEPRESDLVALGSKELQDFYSRKDFGREITIQLRQKIVAKRITDMLHNLGRYTKTIIFCPDIDEAGIMRDLLIRMNQDLVKKDSRYIMRITSDDYEGKRQLDNFIDPESLYPTIVTTSELLSTGVDCKTCGLIVIDKEIESMTNFKQIIGRGTRLFPAKGKFMFDILDFRQATDLFHDPEFDGDTLDGTIDGGDDGGEGGSDGNGFPGGIIVDPPQGSGKGKKGPKQKKAVFKGHNIVIVRETVSVIGADGRTLETTNLIDFTRKNIRQQYASLEDFLQRWNKENRKQIIIDELKEYDVLIDAVKEANPSLNDSDVFDIICHVAYGQKPLTRKERAENVKKRNYFAKYEGKAREVLEALLEKYADQGILNMENLDTLKLNPFTQIGSPVKIVKLFGGKEQYFAAISELEKQLYQNIA
ncbi:MAG: DEAD/DEAH box helicase family protein [Bacteroidales bacterium]|nr:DEAD/DEAH box helicase family protein [Bacteroidales bacterium]